MNCTSMGSSVHDARVHSIDIDSFKRKQIQTMKTLTCSLVLPHDTLYWFQHCENVNMQSLSTIFHTSFIILHLHQKCLISVYEGHCNGYKVKFIVVAIFSHLIINHPENLLVLISHFS